MLGKEIILKKSSKNTNLLNFSFFDGLDEVSNEVLVICIWAHSDFAA